MKKFTLSSLAMLTGMLCLLTSIARGQQSDSFYLKMTHLFQHVEPARVSTGLLRDYGIDFVNVGEYDGVLQTNDNRVSSTVWDDLYTSLYTYRFNSTATGMTHPDNVFSAIRTAGSGATIPLSLLFMKYDEYVDNAVSAGLVTVTTDQIFDRYVGGVWQNPYRQKSVMAVRASQDLVRSYAVTFRLPATLMYTNYTNIQSIQADFADGAGWRTITANTDIPVNYSDTGRKVLQFRVTLTNSQQFVSRSLIGVYPRSAGGVGARVFEDVRVPIAATANHAGGTMEIHYSNNNRALQRITRPLIIAEGFDPWRFGVQENVIFDDFWDTNNIFSGQLRTLLNNSYDIIYLDYNDGTDAIMRNVALLREVIQQVNLMKVPENGIVLPNTVLGISMGGIVSRIALRQMEVAGQNHQTNLFVSLDAPYLGANVPLGLQALNAHVASARIKVGLLSGSIGYVSSVGSVAKALEVYSSPAAKSLLTYYVSANPSNGFLGMDNTQHNNLMTTLTTLGYPVNCRNVAISNGSECATGVPPAAGADLIRLSGNFGTTAFGALALPMVGLTPGTLTNYPQFLIDIIPGPTALKCDFTVRSTAAGGGNQVYNGRIWLEKKVLWLFNVNQTLTSNNYNAPAGVLPLDGYPGGQYTMNPLARQIEALGNSAGETFWQQMQNRFFQKGVNMYMAHPTFTFTPVPHVLDIGRGSVALVAADYTTPYRGATPPPAPKNTPFANFITEFNNGNVENIIHPALLVRSSEWLRQELIANPQLANCGGYCGQAITGAAGICNTPENYAIAGPVTNVMWSVTPANIVTLTPNGLGVSVTRIGSGLITLTADVQGECGAFRIQRGIQVGVPSPVFTNVFRDDATGKISATIEPVPGATAYKWYFNNILITTGPGTVFNTSSNRNACGIVYTIGVEAVTLCGTSPRVSEGAAAPPCEAPFAVTPNPAKSQVEVKVDLAKAAEQDMLMAKQAPVETQEKAPARIIEEVRIVDMQGRLVQHRKYGKGLQKVTLDITGVRPGSYIVLIYNGQTWTSKPIIVID